MQEGAALRSLLISRDQLEQRVGELQALVGELVGRLRTVEGRGDPISYDNVCKAGLDVRKRAREDPGYSAHLERRFPGSSQDPPMYIPVQCLLEYGYMEQMRQMEAMREAVTQAEQAKREMGEGVDFEMRKRQAIIDDVQKQKAELAIEMGRLKMEKERSDGNAQRLRKERDTLYADKKALVEDLQHAEGDCKNAVTTKVRVLQKGMRGVLRKFDMSPDAPLYVELEKLFE